MSEVVETKILNDLRASNHYALMFDETTDCTTIEQMVIRVLFVDPSGNFEVRFVKILDCLESDIVGSNKDGNAPTEQELIDRDQELDNSRIT